MKLMVYSVFDKKAATYSRPFFSVNHAVAIRDFGDAVNDPKNPNVKHVDDFDLYFVGTFDDLTGALIGENAMCLCTGASMVVPKNLGAL